MDEGPIEYLHGLLLLYVWQSQEAQRCNGASRENAS